MRNSLPNEEITARIESALYSAGRPLSIDELLRASGTNSKSNTRTVINELVKKTKSVFAAIEITELADGTFVLQLKPRYTPLIRKFAQRPLIPTSALKTLSYITYEEPVTSKRLVQIKSIRNTLVTTPHNQSQNSNLTRNNLMTAATASPIEEAERS